MNAYITTEYKIDINELKQIVKDYFEDKTGEKVQLQDITFDVVHMQYCEPELNNAVNTEETIKNNVGEF